MSIPLALSTAVINKALWKIFVNANSIPPALPGVGINTTAVIAKLVEL